MTAAWWDATREHRFTVQACPACDHVQHPPRSHCTRCGGTGPLIPREISGAGTVDTFTVVHRGPRADVETPYVLARVRLAEGPVVLTRLPSEPQVGDPVTVGWVDLPDGRSLPVFRPTTQESA
ncbi:OB-fold domain-containing protein [Nocardioides cavernae]|uniref:OB-fold domain-containing protein n=2 Tax=Nocardioides cavernae TaxID=1921566 RepID=A0ABR8NF62_9ACTN|nr:OB-fold domain-containing protein [Nocardioides cavernae]